MSNQMKIKFKELVQLNIVTHLNDNEEPNDELETFQVGEVIEVDLIDYAERVSTTGKLVEDKDLWNVQFGNGSMAFGVSTKWFDVV